VQTAIVSLVALGALLVVVRRVLGAIRPPKGQVACPSCASGSDACGTKVATAASTAGGPAASDVQPLVLVKSKTQ
jgi:hypothetical protein